MASASFHSAGFKTPSIRGGFLIKGTVKLAAWIEQASKMSERIGFIIDSVVFLRKKFFTAKAECLDSGH